MSSDKEPHQEEGGKWSAPLFVQLSELEEAEPSDEEEGEGDGDVWREAARWIKNEDDVETEAGRWGRPHVAALELHALLELRTRLVEGRVLLDVRDVPDLTAAARALTPVPAAPAAPLLHALTLPHTHLLDDSLRLSLHRASRASLQTERGLPRAAAAAVVPVPTAPQPAPSAHRRHSSALLMTRRAPALHRVRRRIHHINPSHIA